MPAVDDKKIEDAILSLTEKRGKYENQVIEIDRIVKNLQRVRLTRRPNPNAKSKEDEYLDIIQDDDRTGKPFTSQVRQQIFDDNIKDAKKLI